MHDHDDEHESPLTPEDSEEDIISALDTALDTALDAALDTDELRASTSRQGAPLEDAQDIRELPEHLHRYHKLITPTQMMWRAIERLKELYSKQPTGAPTAQEGQKNRESQKRPRCAHPRRRRPSAESAPWIETERQAAIEDLGLADLETLILFNLKRAALKVFRVSSVDPDAIAERGLKIWQHQARKHTPGASEAHEDTLGDSLDELRAEENLRRLGAQENGQGFLCAHVRLAHKRLYDRETPIISEPILSEGSDQGAFVLPNKDSESAHAQHQRYAAHMFQERLYADLYAHLSATDFFEDLIKEKESQAPAQVHIIQRWRARIESHTAPLSPQESIWEHTELKEIDLVTTTRRPAACTAEINIEALNLTQLFREEARARRLNEQSYLKSWRRTRDDLSEELSARIEKRQKLLKEEERAWMLKLYAVAREVGGGSAEIRAATQVLAARAQGQLCELNHLPEVCKHPELSIGDPLTDVCVHIAARALFELLSRDRAPTVSTSDTQGR